MLNPFFLNGSKSEQNLLRDLINEHIKIHGVDIYYLPRSFVREDKIIKEVIDSEFNDAFPIEAYINSYDGYGENPVILSKFGIQAQNELTLTISRERFETYITPLISNRNYEVPNRPKEGDIIYFPLGDRLFEIKYVEHESTFYQLQDLYVYELRCELFRYKDEIIDTSIDLVDNTLEYYEENDNDLDLILSGIGITASAYVSGINTSGIVSFTVTNMGYGYSYPPKVIVSKPPEAIVGLGSAILTENSPIICNYNINKKLRSVEKIYVTKSGRGYEEPPKVKIVGDGDGAEAITSIGNGVLGPIIITNYGGGYSTPPSIIFIGECDSPAIAECSIDTDGKISEINIVNSGIGYTVPPLIQIDSPPQRNYGSFEYNENVIGKTSGTKAKVRSWNSKSKILSVYKVTGDFIMGEDIEGEKSKALYGYIIPKVDDDKNYSSNDEIQIQADEILDFSESNPFGIP